MRLNLRKVVCHCILAVGVAAALVASASAQGNIRSVTFYSVKPDRVSDFQAESSNTTHSWQKAVRLAITPSGFRSPVPAPGCSRVTTRPGPNLMLGPTQR